MDWDRGSLPNSNLYLNQIVDDDSSSIVSSSNSTNSSATTVDISQSVNNSAAVDALVIASLIPTKAKPINFDEMPIVTLSDRKQDSEVVLTEDIAELVKIQVPGALEIPEPF